MTITVDFHLTPEGTVTANQLARTGAVAVSFSEGAADVALFAASPEIMRAKLRAALDAVDDAEAGES